MERQDKLISELLKNPERTRCLFWSRKRAMSYPLIGGYKMSDTLEIEIYDLNGKLKELKRINVEYELRKPVIKLYESECIRCGKVTLSQQKTKYCGNKCTVYTKRLNEALAIDTAKAHTDTYHRLYNWQIKTIRGYGEFPDYVG